MKNVILTLCLFFSTAVVSVGGDFYKDNYRSSISLGIGLAGYRGDICADFSCMQFGPSFGISYKYNVNGFFNLRTDINYFLLNQKDVYAERNLGFRTHNVELFLAGELGLFKNRFLSPYIFAGVGIDRFDAQAQAKNGDWISLRSLRTENVDYKPGTVILPFGLGCYLKLSSRIQFNFEGGFRKTFTDYLDDVSGPLYQPLDSFGNPMAADLSMRSDENSMYAQSYLSQIRGNPRRKDHYLIFMFKVKINF